MFQGLKSHKPEFADELVRSNEKGPPSEPSTYHTSQAHNFTKIKISCLIFRLQDSPDIMSIFYSVNLLFYWHEFYVIHGVLSNVSSFSSNTNNSTDTLQSE